METLEELKNKIKEMVDGAQTEAELRLIYVTISAITSK